MGTVENAGDLPARSSTCCTYFVVNRFQVIEAEIAPAEPRLIGSIAMLIARPGQIGDSLDAARDRVPVSARANVLVGVLVDDAIAVQDDTVASRLLADNQLRDVSHLQEKIAQRFQQIQAILRKALHRRR